MNIISKINPDQIKQDWHSRGYSFGVFRDPPGQVWTYFVHKTDELVVLIKGEIELEIYGNSQRPQIGQEVFIPAKEIWKTNLPTLEKLIMNSYTF